MKWGGWGPYWVLKRSLRLAEPGNSKDFPFSALHQESPTASWKALPFISAFYCLLGLTHNVNTHILEHRRWSHFRVSSLLRAGLRKGRAGGGTDSSILCSCIWEPSQPSWVERHRHFYSAGAGNSSECFFSVTAIRPYALCASWHLEKANGSISLKNGIFLFCIYWDDLEASCLRVHSCKEAYVLAWVCWTIATC